VTELDQTCRRDRADITQSPNQNFHVASLSTGTATSLGRVAVLNVQSG
jgi:hypothetical protein